MAFAFASVGRSGAVDARSFGTTVDATIAVAGIVVRLGCFGRLFGVVRCLLLLRELLVAGPMSPDAFACECTLTFDVVLVAENLVALWGSGALVVGLLCVNAFFAGGAVVRAGVCSSADR
jgi:hypothetical protein